jgi:hypothetical protein
MNHLSDSYRIPSGVLHKGSADDVLICRPRRALPCCLELREAGAEATALALAAGYEAQADGRLRLALQPPADRKDHFGAGAAGGLWSREQTADLRALPYELLGATSFTAVPPGRDADAGNTEPEAGVARLLDALPTVRPGTSVAFLNTADHYFFYRKAHEHVPGTMLIEAARQAVYYHFYTHTRHQRGAVTVSLNDLGSSFFAYADLMYPIELVVDEIEGRDSRLPRRIGYRVSFYQRRRLFGVVDTRASVIEIGLFEKMRNIFLTCDDWFMPLDGSKLACELNLSTGERLDVALRGISRSGCVLEAPAAADAQQATVSIRYEGGFELSTPVRLSGRDKDETSWVFTSLRPAELGVVSEMVKRGFVATPAPACSDVCA